MSERSERMKLASDALLVLSAKWRKEADDLDLLGMGRGLHPYERAAYRGGARRIRRMADELDSANCRKSGAVAPERKR